MTTTFALGAIPDRLSKHACGYLDLFSLARLARASSKFHALVYTLDSDLAKVEIVAKRYRPRDLGLCVTEPSAYHPTMINSGLNTRVVAYLASSFAISYLHFLPEQVALEKTYYVTRSAHHLFTKDKSEKLQVRDLKGELLTTFKEGDPMPFRCFELNAPAGRVQIAVVEAKPNISVWDITQLEAPQKVKEHGFGHNYPLAADVYQFGNLLILLPNIHHSRTFPYTYDLAHPETPPKELLHPKNYQFRCQTLRNSNQFFILAEARKYALAYQIENGELQPVWEADLEAIGIKKANLIAANNHWLVVGPESRVEEAKNSDEQHARTIFDLTLFDAKTGQNRGSFSVSVLLTSMNPDHTLDIWGNDILVIKDEQSLHMWQLPSGTPLPTLTPGGDLIQAEASMHDLTLLYREENTRHIRACSWTTPLDPANKVSMPDKAGPEKGASTDETGSLWGSIYEAFTSFCSWIGSLWNWLWRAL